jgi:hypothetical protein
MAWPPNEKIQVLTILPIRGMYHPLICRSRVVICLHRRDFIYIALGLNGNSSRLDYFSIPLLHRLDFSCFCIESHLCMYRRIRRCDDFPLQALCDFRVIFGAIFQDFHSSQDSSIWGCFSLDFSEGIMGECLVPLCGLSWPLKLRNHFWFTSFW